MIRKNASNAIERMILANIHKYGWHSNSVGIDPDTAFFAYTVGFFSSFRHPELLVFGLPPETCHGIFAAAAQLIARGHSLDPNTPNKKLLAGRDCIAVNVPGRHYADFVNSACWYYNGNRFPLYQIVWPSEEGLYPWHQNATNEFVRDQPVLGRFSVGA